MLVLSRRLNEKIVFPGIETTVQVIDIKPGSVRLGIEAPSEVIVLREELVKRAAEWQAPLSGSNGTALPSRNREINHLLRNRLTVAGVGLSLLRSQLQAGDTEEAEATVSRLQEDFLLLLQRLENEVADGTALESRQS